MGSFMNAKIKANIFFLNGKTFIDLMKMFFYFCLPFFCCYFVGNYFNDFLNETKTKQKIMEDNNFKFNC